MPSTKRATIAVKLYAPSLIGTLPIEDRRRSRVKAQPRRASTARNARPKSRKDRAARSSFDQKAFANSYGACVSSPRSYRCKQPKLASTSSLESEMLQSVQECKRTLAELDRRLLHNETLVHVPALRAVKNLMTLDYDRTMIAALKTWKEFTYAKRQAEQRRIQLKRARRTAAEGFVDGCVDSALVSAWKVIESRRPNDDKDARAYMVQKWRRSRTVNNTTRLNQETGDGRVSHFILPAPDLSKYTSKHRKGHQKQSQRIGTPSDNG